MGATEEILSPIRLLNTHPRAIQEGTTVMTRCAATRMSLLHAKCSGGLIALKTNTVTARATAEARLSTHTEPETGMEGPVIHHMRIPTTTVPFTAPTLTLTLARPQTHLTTRATTGLSTSVPLERSTTTTAGQRCRSGRSQKSGSRESNGRKNPQRRQWSTVSPKTETTEERPCRHQPRALEPSRSKGRSLLQWPSLPLPVRGA